MTAQKQECIELIKSFINERLDGDIQKLHDYDLDQLEKDEKYGAYDPDNSKIANAIYVVLWGDILPNLTMDNLGDKMYRGDTMNSFNTLMGRPNENGTNFLGIQKYTHDSNIINMARKYHEKYHTIGNLMILPNKTPELERTTLNQLRGGGAWYDYFDLFLSDIRNLMIGTNTSRIDNRLKRLVDINSHYFDCFRGQDGFTRFCKNFYLDNYVDSQYLKVYSIFAPYARHWPTKYSEEEYKRYVTAYITKATEIIDYRCSRMIEDLEIEILKYDPTFPVSPKATEQESSNKSTEFIDDKDTKTGTNDYIKEKLTGLLPIRYICSIVYDFKNDTVNNFGKTITLISLMVAIMYACLLWVKCMISGKYFEQFRHFKNLEIDNLFQQKSTLNTSYLDGTTYTIILILITIGLFGICIKGVHKRNGIKKKLLNLFTIISWTGAFINIAGYKIMHFLFYTSAGISWNSWDINLGYGNLITYTYILLPICAMFFSILCLLSVILSCFLKTTRRDFKFWFLTLLAVSIGIPIVLFLLEHAIAAIIVIIVLAIFLIFLDSSGTPNEGNKKVYDENGNCIGTINKEIEKSIRNN